MLCLTNYYYYELQSWQHRVCHHILTLNNVVLHQHMIIFNFVFDSINKNGLKVSPNLFQLIV